MYSLNSLLKCLATYVKHSMISVDLYEIFITIQFSTWNFSFSI